MINFRILPFTLRIPGTNLLEDASEGASAVGGGVNRIRWSRCIGIRDFMQERDKNDDPIVASRARARFYCVEPWFFVPCVPVEYRVASYGTE